MLIAVLAALEPNVAPAWWLGFGVNAVWMGESMAAHALVGGSPAASGRSGLGTIRTDEKHAPG